MLSLQEFVCFAVSQIRTCSASIPDCNFTGKSHPHRHIVGKLRITFCQKLNIMRRKLSHKISRSMYRCQWRIRKLCHVNIVKSHNRNILRNAVAFLVKGAHRPNSDRVAGCKNGTGKCSCFDKFHHHLLTGICGKLCFF